MSSRKLLYATFPLLLVAGCATSSGYQKERTLEYSDYSLNRVNSNFSDLNHSMEKPKKSSLLKILDLIY